MVRVNTLAASGGIDHVSPQNMVLKICKYPCLPGNSMIQRLTDYLGVSREPVVLVETILNAVYPPKVW
ncbi:MAG: hypothetical protein QOE48_5714 [Mycobacterium sp.]|jgi:hypothetical protein|nr:hypothetical protein [Mycobacterium sp.]